MDAQEMGYFSKTSDSKCGEKYAHEMGYVSLERAAQKMGYFRKTRRRAGCDSQSHIVVKIES